MIENILAKNWQNLVERNQRQEELTTYKSRTLTGKHTSSDELNADVEQLGTENFKREIPIVVTRHN